jgi:acyl-CoA reductase-like NAD-dependent aldehyde dehydrogenase
VLTQAYDVSHDLHPGEVWIGGRWMPATGGRIPLVDPTTEQLLGESVDAGPAAVESAVAAARQAYDGGHWARLPLAERAAVLERVLEAVVANGERFAQLQTAQMGAPLTVSRALVQGAMRMFRAYAECAQGIGFTYLRRDAVGQSLVNLDPVGVVAIVIPWNGPLSSLVSKAVPALLMGCTVVLKPAPETPLEAGLFAELCRDAGLPDGVFNVVTGGAATGEALVTAAGVDKVSFTGSTTAGRRVGELCGRSFTRVSLELGGKSAGIVLPDADLALTVPELVNGNFFNTGQICVALSRVLLPASRYDEFLDALCETGASRVVGDPRDPGTAIGPLVSSRQRDRVEASIAAGRASGARLVLGGGRPAGLDRGWFVEPTIFAEVDNRSVLAREEVFGPVMSVLRYQTQSEAVALANDSAYGLHGAVFSADPAAALAVARGVRSGSVAVNTANLTPATPYGGVKSSGIGREHGREGLESFLESTSYVLPADLADRYQAAGVVVA